MVEVRVRQDHVLHVGRFVADVLDLLVERVGLAPFERQMGRHLAPVADRVIDDLRVASGVEQH